MGMLDQFFKAKSAPDAAGDAVGSEAPRLSLQLLYAAAPAYDAAALTAALRAYDPELKRATVEIEPVTAAAGTPLGRAAWGKHAVDLVGFDVPMPAAAVEHFLLPSHLTADLKAKVRKHRAHLLLYYAGSEPDRLEQYVALAAVAGVFGELGAIVVANEGGRTSFPAAALSRDGPMGPMMDTLRELPLTMLYCGLNKIEIQGERGVWMRTVGADLLGLPDFATRAKGHGQTEKVSEIFNSVLQYLRTSGATMAAGHTMQVGADLFMKLRDPREGEDFLETDGTMLVAKFIRADEING